MTLIHVNTALVADAAQQIHTAYAQTDANYDRSLQILNSNPDVFGGRGSEAFTQVYSMLNSQYAAAKDTIRRAGVALGVANDGFSQTDAQMAAQYPA